MSANQDPRERVTVYEGPIAGVTYGAFRLRPDRLLGRDLLLVREPENEYDDKAIAVFAIEGVAGRKVGYIPRVHTWRLHEAYAEKRILKARCVSINTKEIGFGKFVSTPRIHVWYEKAPDRPSDARPLRPAGSRRLILS